MILEKPVWTDGKYIITNFHRIFIYYDLEQRWAVVPQPKYHEYPLD